MQYLDVGIKLEVEPQIYAEGDVGIKLFLDVSNIVKEIPGRRASLAYQIGTRSAQTNLRLRDGETQILGGLISELDRKTASKVPGLGQLPVLGRLFTNNNSSHVKTEIILSITPRIVRSVATADASLRDIYSGTESSMRQAPLRLDPVGAAGGAPTVVSGVAPGGSRPEAPSIERTPRPTTGTGASSAAAPTAEPATAGGAPAGAAPPTPVGEAAPASAEPTPSSPAPNTAIEPTSSSGPPASTSPSSVSATNAVAPPASASIAAAASASSPGATAPTTSAPNPTAAGPGPAELTINGPPSVRVGEEFDVTIDAAISAPLKGLPLLIRFDPKVLTFVDARPDDLARKSGIEAATPKLEPSTGRLGVDLQAVGPALSGEGKLLRLRFAAKAVRPQTAITLGPANLPGNVAARSPAQSTSLRLRVEP